MDEDTTLPTCRDMWHGIFIPSLSSSVHSLTQDGVGWTTTLCLALDDQSLVSCKLSHAFSPCESLMGTLSYTLVVAAFGHLHSCLSLKGNHIFLLVPWVKLLPFPPFLYKWFHHWLSWSPLSHVILCHIFTFPSEILVASLWLKETLTAASMQIHWRSLVWQDSKIPMKPGWMS